jgi:hypothetical protein
LNNTGSSSIGINNYYDVLEEFGDDDPWFVLTDT